MWSGLEKQHHAVKEAPALPRQSPLAMHRDRLRRGELTPQAVAEESLARANRNASRNTYPWLDPDRLRADAETLAPAQAEHPPLYAVPASLKDCFDLAGVATTFGCEYYGRTTPPAQHDSWMAERLRVLGCLITGKTHLHPLAYGITGENADYGDCLQPRDPGLLTGGSSSGAVASVQEGSALFAIGTDTGGSIRVPAALCGLFGLRTSHNIRDRIPGIWRGGRHLAPSFDTPGFFVRDPRDLAPIAEPLFEIPRTACPATLRIGFAEDSFFADASAAVQAACTLARDWLAHMGTVEVFSSEQWKGTAAYPATVPLYTAIQAHEAAAIHAGHFDHLPAAIAERLRWGASIGAAEIAALRRQHAAFQQDFARLWERFDLLVLPCAPISQLPAGADNGPARMKTLRYTAPFSLAGVPVLTLPGEAIGAPRGTGVQIATAPGMDGLLLALSTRIGHRLADKPA